NLLQSWLLPGSVASRAVVEYLAYFLPSAQRLSADTADSFVKENVDAGKTVFIRWIASAPSWNSVVAEFGKHPDVVFGDVALSKNQVRTIHGESQNPGAGGWPTVRYFNKETGYGGKSYPKKTSQAMCDELGPKESYLRPALGRVMGLSDRRAVEAWASEWVEEFASLCDANATDKKGCSDQQVKFIEKWSGKPSEELKSQLQRLQGMLSKDGSSMKADTLKWVKQRAKLIEQLSQKTEL
ncbi:unnamed protein product, partial [Effrenium voratum]